MKLNEIKNKMQMFVMNADWGATSRVKQTQTITKFNKTLRMIDDLKSLKVLPDDISELNSIDSIKHDYNWSSDTIDLPYNVYVSLNNCLNRIKQQAEIVYRSLSYITKDEEPYLINIKLSKTINSIEDYAVFNDNVIKLFKHIEKLQMNNKSVCKVRFAGFEKGSDILQIVIDQVQNVDVDMVYAFLMKIFSLSAAISISKKEKYKSKIKKLEYEALKKKFKDEELKKIEEDSLNQTIKEEIAQIKDELGVDLNDTLALTIVKETMVIIEAGNEISPSLNAPSYVEEHTKTIEINYKELKKVIDKNTKKIEDKSSKKV